jgi:hypothetical protein
MNSKNKMNATNMNIREFCEIHNIQTMPIHLDFKDTEKKLQDGSVKKDKILLKYDVVGTVSMNDLDNVEKCNKRWLMYNEGNVNDYNFIAIDTKRVRVIDIDCILPDFVDGQPNPIKKLMNNHPYKKSTSKNYGSHVLIVDNVDYDGIRNKQKFHKKYGEDENGQAGVEYLNGIWAWSDMNANVENAHNNLQVDTRVLNIRDAIIAKKVKIETKQSESKQNKQGESKYKALDSSGTYNFVNKINEEKKDDWRDYDLEDVKNKLLKKPPSYYADYNKAGGCILNCAASQDEAVYDILLKVMKRGGSNFINESWVRDRWDSYDSNKHSNYSFDWYKTPDLSDFKMLFTDEDVGKCFLKIYKDVFMIQINNNERIMGVYSWDKIKKTWLFLGNKKDSYDGLSNFIYCEISSKIKPKFEKQGKAKLLQMKDEIIKMKNENNDDDICEKEEEYKNFSDIFNKCISQLSSNYKLLGMTSWVKKRILVDASLKKEIQFNLEKNTRHLFQFKNGAFNLRTGLLQERTKEMYITQYNKYDYSNIKDEKRIVEIENMMKQTFPEEEMRIAHYKWRGLCLTGQTEEQQLIINIGYGAGNGKSNLSKWFSEAFPIYCKKISNGAFSKGKNTFNKAFSSLINRPIRLVYMEEWGTDNIDEEQIKSVIDSDKITVQPLFHEETIMNIQLKIEANANFDPNAKKDNGMERRANIFKYKSKFVTNKKDVDEEKNIYLQNRKVSIMMHDDSNKLALFHIYSPYAKDYYDNGLTLPQSLKEDYAETTSSNDVWEEFFDERIIKIEGGSILKKDLIQEVKNRESVDFPEYLQKFIEIKRAFNVRGYKYDSQKKEGHGNSRKGFMLGCLLKSDFQ